MHSLALGKIIIKAVFLNTICLVLILTAEMIGWQWYQEIEFCCLQSREAFSLLFQPLQGISDLSVAYLWSFRYLREPLVIRESTETQVPVLLAQIFKSVECNTNSDALWVVLHTLMLESGFLPSEVSLYLWQNQLFIFLFVADNNVLVLFRMLFLSLFLSPVSYTFQCRGDK